MDTSLFFFINQGLQNNIFDLIMPFITKRAYIFFILVILPFFLKDQRKSLFVIALALITLAVGDASSNILKHLFQRPRPCHELENIRLLVGCGGSFSFPSGHTVNAFAVAMTLSYFFKKATLPVFLIAVIVAFSRIYIGVHYPSDVIAGTIWGGIIAGIIIFLYKWSSKRFGERPYSTILCLSLIGLTFFRYYYIVTGPLDLSPDEAHYWEWSRRLDLSYYSKGPVIAYLIAATTSLMGDTVLGVRFLAPVFLALSSIFIYKLTKELFPEDKDIERKACIAGLLLQVTPLFATYGVVMTIDSPFVFFWTLSLYLFWKAVNRNALCVMRNGFIMWIFLGISVGLGLLTKYTMAFFYLSAFLFLISSKQQRVWFKRKELYIAFVLSLLIFSPVIVWNLNHDWVTLKHVAGQAHIAEGVRVSFKHFFEFLGSQIGVISPLLFFLVIYGAVKNFNSKFKVQSSRFLFWFWAPVLGFFILKSLQGKVQANWAMPAYITAFIASMDYFLGDVFRKKIKILLSLALIMALSIAVIAHYSEVLNLPVKMDPSSRLKGWKEIGIKLEEIYKGMSLSGGRQVFIFSDKYQVSSELAFYMPSKPRTYCINLGSRMNQYDIWGGFDNLLGFDAIFVRIDNENFPEELKDSFDSYEMEKFIVKKKDKILREYFIFKCFGFRGLPLKEVQSY